MTSVFTVCPMHIRDGLVYELEVLVYDFNEQLDDSMSKPEEVRFYQLYSAVV
jgi:hypothetical protein